MASGEILDVPGVRERTAEVIADGLGRIDHRGAGLPVLRQARLEADRWAVALGGLPGVARAVVAGQVRRGVQQPSALELLAVCTDPIAQVAVACWMVDMDALVWLERDDPRQRELLDHVLADHQDEPGAILGAAEMHERLDDHDTATELYRKAWTRGLASGQPMIAEVAEQGLERIGEEPPQPTSKVGRNDPCPCGSGKKFKKCCGR